MRSASIDVGSNTLRVLVGDVHDNTLSRLYSDRAITRLAEGIGDSGILKKENMDKSISALKNFSSSISEYGIVRVSAVGTSALREAQNSQDFIAAAFRESGIRIRVISGMEEAELTAKGILLGFRQSGAPLLIVDIGGGSTEWIVFDPELAGASSCGSLPLGVINLLERFVKTDPISPFDLDVLNRDIYSRLLRLKKEISGLLPSNATLVGTGGTVTTLASLDLGLRTYEPEKIHMHKISLGRLQELRDLLLSLPLSKRQRINGLEPGRADLIIPGILLTIKLMEFFGFHDITVSDYGLLEGLLKETDE